MKIKRFGVAAVGAMALSVAVGRAQASASLFTTQSDFALWTSRSPTTVAPSGLDFDGSAFNGAANAAPGAISPGGSLMVVTPDIGDAAFTVNLAGNALFMSLIDPGSTPTSTAAYTGPLAITYTVPTTAGDTGFNLGLNLAYDADGFYDDSPAVTVYDDGIVNGLLTRTAVFNYTIVAGPMREFDFRVAYNSSTTITSPFYIDSIYVPEPGTGLLALGGAGVAFLRRARR